MNKILALKIPGFNGKIDFPGDTDPATKYPTLGAVIGGLYEVAVLVSFFLLVFYMSWGVYQYLFSGGSKEILAKARSKITWAIIGFLLVMIAFSVKNYAVAIFFEDKPTNGIIQNILTPVDIGPDTNAPPVNTNPCDPTTKTGGCQGE